MFLAHLRTSLESFVCFTGHYFIFQGEPGPEGSRGLSGEIGNKGSKVI